MEESHTIAITMKNLSIWIYIIVAVAVALLANSISAIWAQSENKFSIWLIPVLVISPFVFITFGLTTSRLGVAVSSGTVDSLLTISTIAVGLVIFQEWNRLSGLQYLGLLLALSGIFLMVFFPKEIVSSDV